MYSKKITSNYQSLVQSQTAIYEQFFEQLSQKGKLYKAMLHYKDIPSEFYLVYPFLFADAFDIVDKKTLEKLSLAGALMYKSILVFDQLVDKKVVRSKKEMFISFQVIQILQEETIKLLTDIFGRESSFWNYWEQRRSEYNAALELEHKISEKCSQNLFYNIADHKSAFGKVAIDACHVLSGKYYTDTYKNLLESHRQFSIGVQITDDIKDLKEDAENRQFNWAAQSIYQYLNHQKIDVGQLKTFDINKLLYIEGIASQLIHDSLDHLEKAITISSTKAKHWIQVVSCRMQKSEKDLQYINEYLAIVDKRFDIHVHSDSQEKSISVAFEEKVLGQYIATAAQYIFKEKSGGYKELQHIMYFNESEGFTCDEPVQVTDIFQRAIVTDALIDLYEVHPDKNLLPLIDDEINYLLLQRRDEGVGGWSYYREVLEIAPDADDLGQILRCLTRASRHEEVQNYCVPLIETLFEDAPSDGSFETWIVPGKSKSPIQKKQDLFNATKWGKGPDNEVVANLILALVLDNQDLYQTRITKGCTYLISQQSDNGSWSSRWYVGEYYGTYLCMTLLSMMNLSDAQPINKAIDFIINTQKKDGGWGIDDKSDPLNTAFALLSIINFQFDKKSDIIKRGMKYLENSMDTTSKYWRAIPFIIPKIGIPYESSTITTAFVLKCLIACSEYK